MQIENIRYTFDPDGYPFIEFKMDGEPVKLCSYSLKRPILERGYVSFGPEWSGRLPEIIIPPSAGNNGGRMCAGVQDMELARICLKFLDDREQGLTSPS